MPVKAKKTSLTKALMVIMLVVRSTMGMATADLSPEDALRTFQASDTLDMDLTPHVSKQKRYLRSAADVTTTSTGELRRLVSDLSGLKEFGNSLGKQAVAFPARLRQSVSAIYSKMMTRIREKWWLWVNKQKEPKEAFTSLQLGKSGKNPFENPKFPVWKYIVEKTTPKEDVTKVMFETMVHAFAGEDKVYKVLVEAKSLTKYESTIESLYNYQIEQWVHNDDYSPDLVFKILGLNKITELDKLPSRPEFSTWAAFNTKKKSEEKAFEFLKEPESTTMHTDLMRGLADFGEADANFKFAQDLLRFQLQFLEKEETSLESSFELFNLQEKGTSNPTDLTTDLLGRLWVDFVYMRAQREDGSIRFGEVYDKFFDKIGHDAAVDVMEMTYKDGYFLKSLEKEKPLKGKEVVFEELYEAILKALGGEGELAKALAHSTKFGHMSENVYKYQIDQWDKRGVTTGRVFDILGLNTFKKFDELPSRPEFSMWAAFNTEKKSEEKAFEFLKGSKGRIINLDLMRTLAKIGEADANFEFAQDLLRFQLQFLKKNTKVMESSFKLFNLQGKGTSNPTDLTTDLLGRLWVDFVYMRAQREDGSIRFGEVYDKFFDKIGHDAAVDVMEMTYKDGYFLKSLEKEKPLKGKEVVFEELYEAMLKALGGEGELAKALAHSTKFGHMSENVYKYQIDQWDKRGVTTGRVFDILGLNTFKKFDELPSRPEFSMWAAFNTEKKSEEKAFEFLKGSKGRIINLDLMRTLAKIGEADANFEFAQDLLRFQLQFLKENSKDLKSSFKLFNLQGKGTSNPTDLTTHPLGRLWVNYVFMRAQGESGIIDFREVYKRLKKRVGQDAAVAVMKMVHKDGYFMKSLEKEKPIKGDKDFDSFMKDLREKMAKNSK
ncbi:unnamed protein product [Peronospora farinosa]|uniref:Uncharacterized protein n=1 Tax=Peronospora farinosa TaxID=134698 RepID=A0AAV0TA49_9STRA|nr:unnamed protein product [Peronospora farinosa]CAI5717108.1 unnamed protein product [Peronospora farinosa]